MWRKGLHSYGELSKAQKNKRSGEATGTGHDDRIWRGQEEDANGPPLCPKWAGRCASKANRKDPLAGNTAISQQREMSKQKVGKR